MTKNYTPQMSANSPESVTGSAKSSIRLAVAVAAAIASMFIAAFVPATSLADELTGTEATQSVAAAAQDAGVQPATGAAEVKDTAAGVAASVPGSLVSLVLPKADVQTTNTEATVVSGPGTSQAAVQEVGEDGKRVTLIINSASDPERYSIRFTAAARLDLGDDGRVNVYDADGNLDSTLEPAWAKDANGATVPTHYEIDGTTLIQVVDHRAGNYSMPISADPWWRPALISGVRWSGSTLQVYPTTFGRYPWLAGSSLRWAAWGEILARAPGANRANMADQFFCHWDFVRWRAPNKASWNLDASRPNVGYWNTVNAGCNP